MIRTAVIGAGYLGKFHARKYAHLGSSELVGVADINESCGQSVATDCGTQYYRDYRALIGKVDAVSVVVPTTRHYEVASDFLNAGVHVLVEKPITSNVVQAEALIGLARRNNLVLQVGFLERFNAALGSVLSEVHQPRFIESHRLAAFKPRSMDVNVIMDLMIHDLDIILSLVDSPLVDIAANGTAVLCDSIDIAQARLTFENRCVANVTASRISQKAERKMRIFQDHGCICVDFQSLKVSCFAKGQGELYPGIPAIECQEQTFQDDDALKSEIEDFLHCINGSGQPRVSGEDGRNALALGHEISRIIAEGQP